MSYEDYRVGLAKVEELKASRNSPNIFLVISRSKNQNLVIYEAVKSGSDFNAEKPVDVYWLDIDPEYVAKTRAKGVQDDRTELNMLEKQFAYGLSWTKHKDGGYELKLVALPEKLLHLELGHDGKLHCWTTIAGQRASLCYVYVNSVDRTLRLPKVVYVDLVGHTADGKPVFERLAGKD